MGAKLQEISSGKCLGSLTVLWGQEGDGSRGGFDANSHVLLVPAGGSYRRLSEHCWTLLPDVGRASCPTLFYGSNGLLQLQLTSRLQQDRV